MRKRITWLTYSEREAASVTVLLVSGVKVGVEVSNQLTSLDIRHCILQQYNQRNCILLL